MILGKNYTDGTASWKVIRNILGVGNGGYDDVYSSIDHTHDDRYSLLNHTHNYAGSSSAGGSATTIATTLKNIGNNEGKILFSDPSNINQVDYNNNITAIPELGAISSDSIIGYDKKYFAYVKGGYYATNTNPETGCITIQLPVTYSGNFVTFTVDIYDYSINGATTYIINFYNSNLSNRYLNYTIQAIGKNIQTVRLGHNDTKCVVTIGDVTTNWHDPKVVIRDVSISILTDSVGDWLQPWAISVESELPSTVQNTFYKKDISIVSDALSNNNNGYVKLSNGIIIQWGYITNGSAGENTVSFPIAFTTKCNSLVLSPVTGNTTSSSSIDLFTQSLCSVVSESAFKYYQRGSQKICWQAIGY